MRQSSLSGPSSMSFSIALTGLSFADCRKALMRALVSLESCITHYRIDLRNGYHVVRENGKQGTHAQPELRQCRFQLLSEIASNRASYVRAKCSERESKVAQLQLFAGDLPEGFVYRPEFISAEEEQTLVRRIEQLSFAQIKMHGVVAKRRAAHFGRGYEYESGRIAPGAEIPDFFLPLRARVGEFAGRDAEEFAELLVTDYPAGSGIGWHRDAPAFDIVVGVSLVSECTMQFRRWPVKKKGERPLRTILEPRSAYILSGPSRTRWQHHIAATKNRRLSLTFRTLRKSV